MEPEGSSRAASSDSRPSAFNVLWTQFHSLENLLEEKGVEKQWVYASQDENADVGLWTLTIWMCVCLGHKVKWTQILKFVNNNKSS